MFYLFVLLFFFFKQKTAYEMRISDWSSDVCSSDLVDLAQHADQAGLVDVLLGVGESRARPHLLQHVVEPGHGEPLVLLQHRLALRVQPRAEVADARLQRLRRIGKGERIEAGRLDGDRSGADADSTACSQCPRPMTLRR